MIDSIKFRLSMRGVPHTLVEVDGITYSICFFGKTKLYRVWRYDNQNELLFDIALENGKHVSFEDEVRAFLKEKNI